MVTQAPSITALKPALAVAALVCSMCAGAVMGGELIRPSIELNDLRVVVTHLSTGDLLNLQRRYGVRVDVRDIRQSHHHGFTIVKRDSQSGVFTCEIYLPNEKRPRMVDDDATLTIGHELLHCLFGEYHP